jgi:hypothetical protein
LADIYNISFQQKKGHPLCLWMPFLNKFFSGL